MADPMVLGSLHKHTSGYGYGTWRLGPPKGFAFATRSNDAEPDKPRQVNTARRAEAARRELVSGEIGEWLYGEKRSPSHPVPRVRPTEPKLIGNTPHRAPDWRQRPDKIVDDNPVDVVVPELVRPPQTDLNLDQGRLDPTFSRAHYRQDLFLHKKPDAYQKRLPFASQLSPHAAFAQNELSASLTTHWTHTLRGQKW